GFSLKQQGKFTAEIRAMFFNQPSEAIWPTSDICAGIKTSRKVQISISAFRMPAAITPRALLTVSNSVNLKRFYTERMRLSVGVRSSGRFTTRSSGDRNTSGADGSNRVEHRAQVATTSPATTSLPGDGSQACDMITPAKPRMHYWWIKV